MHNQRGPAPIVATVATDGTIAIIGMASIADEPTPRMLLEAAWQALEDAHLPPERTAATRTGVFVGVPTADYAQFSMAANRISYTFDLRGPSLMLDTAGSSSLVAVHYACLSIHSGESETALAGGEGEGLIVLKPLTRALQDGDRVYATIRTSAVAHDGRSKGPTQPADPTAQAHTEVTRRPMRAAAPSTSTSAAHAAPDHVRYLESGTGGVGGLIKLAQALYQRDAPGPWPEGEGPLVGVVNSFGVGGTNVRVVLEEAPGAVGARQPQQIRALIPKAERRQEHFPLTFAQERTLFSNAPEATRVIAQHGLVDGPLNIAALEQAIERLTQIHETLTTVFVRAPDGKSVLQRLGGSTPKLDYADLVPGAQDPDAQDPDAQSPDAQILDGQYADDLRTALEDRLMHVERLFDPFEAPMHRIALTRIGDQQHVLSIALDHLIADGWSMALLFQDLVRAYEGAAAETDDHLEATPLRLVDYAQWERATHSGQSSTSALADWPEPQLPFVRARLRSQPQAHDVYLSNEARVTTTQVPVSTLERLASATATTLPTLVLTAFLLALADASASTRVAIPATVNTRDHYPDLDRTLGPLTTTHLIGVDFSTCSTRRQALMEVSAASSGSRYADPHPHRIALHHLPEAESPEKLGEATISLLPRRSARPLDHDIVLFAQTAPSTLRLSLAYTAGIVDDEGARRLAAAVADHLTALADRPDEDLTRHPHQRPAPWSAPTSHPQRR